MQRKHKHHSLNITFFRDKLVASLFIIIFCTSIVSPTVSGQTNSEKQSVLWKIQKNGSANTSYLLGTYHSFGAKWVNSFPLIDTLIKNADVFLCENTLRSNSKEMNHLAEQLQEEKRTAKEIFGNDFNTVNEFLKKETGVGLDQLDRLGSKKGMAILELAGYLTMCVGDRNHLKIASDQSLDEVLLTQAETLGKECVPLDSEKNISQVIDSKKYLKEIVSQEITLVNISTGRNSDLALEKEFLESLKNYDKGEKKYFFNLNYPSMTRKLVAKRNKSWLKQLPQFLDKKNCFIAVGAGHLDYKKGLINELSAKGFHVVPVTLRSL